MTKPKILVVDDEPLNLEFLEGVLGKDYKVSKASSGIDALIKLENSSPDLILLDILMPNMNGYALCKEIKSNNKTMSIPIVMITALEEREARMKAHEAGADDCMSKPININLLNQKVRSLIIPKNQKMS